MDDSFDMPTILHGMGCLLQRLNIPILCIPLTIGCITPVLAQAPAFLAQTFPSGAPQPIVPQGSPLPRVLPAQPPAVAPARPAQPVTPNAALPNQPVRISRVVVEGVTAYPPAEIEALTQGLVGPDVPLARIEAARTAVLRRYRADGYILSAVSANIDAAGTLRFVVTEGRIASVKLAGDIGPAGTQVLRFLNRLTEHQPIDSVTLERYLLLAQDVPGITLHAVLQPSADEPGAVNLIAEVSRQPVSGLALMDNRASPYTGPLEGLAVLDLNSFTEFGEKTELSLYHAFPNSETFGQVSTEAYAGASGLKVRIYGGYGPTVPTGLFAAEGYNGTTGGVRRTGHLPDHSLAVADAQCLWRVRRHRIDHHHHHDRRAPACQLRLAARGAARR